MISYVLAELAIEVNSATDSRQSSEAVNTPQLSIVRHLKAAIDRVQLRKGDVSNIHIADEGQAGTDGGQVRRGDGVEVVAVEAERAIERAELWNVDRRAVAEGHVVGPYHTGEADCDVATIGFERQRSANVGELHRD